MKILAAIVVIISMMMTGCVSYKLVEPGSKQYSGLEVNTSQAWNEVPKQLRPFSRPNSATWTQDGVMLDRILIIPAVADGESILKRSTSQQALPVYSKEMTPKDIEELTESSMLKMFGEGQVSVETENLRPHKFGDQRGFLFDLAMAVTDGPNYQGVTGAFTSEEKLYLLIFLGAKPHYFDKHRDEALAIIRGAALAAP